MKGKLTMKELRYGLPGDQLTMKDLKKLLVLHTKMIETGVYAVEHPSDEYYKIADDADATFGRYYNKFIKKFIKE
jgi:hypothetical protein